MIDRIKQLAEQAGMRTVTYEHDEDTYFTDSLDPQKFAELIIRECLHAVEDAGGIDKYHYTTAISEHFGVKND